MNRYFALLNSETLEVYATELLEIQPENTVLFFENDFIKAKFDNYPPTSVIEGASEEEIKSHNDSLIPQTISQMRFRMQLILSGISIASIYEMIDTIEDETMREIVLAKFDYAQEMERNDESLNFMAQKMGMTSEQVDQIFIGANNIQEK